MAIGDWIPALTVPGALALIAYWSRKLIVTRLTRAVSHEYDKKLAVLKADLDGSQSALRAELQAKQAQLDTFRSVVLSGFASRQAAVDKRRIEAVDQLWEAVRLLGSAKATATVMSKFHFEALLKEVERNPKAADIVKPLSFPIEKMAEVSLSSHSARPYLSPLAWAYFAAFQSILMFSVVQAMMVQHRLTKPELLNEKHVVNLAIAALPEQKAYLEEHGAIGAFYLLDTLESRLLGELTRTLKVGAGDNENAEQAAGIIQAVEELNKDVEAAKGEVNSSESDRRSPG